MNGSYRKAIYKDLREYRANLVPTYWHSHATLLALSCHCDGTVVSAGKHCLCNEVFIYDVSGDNLLSCY